jgi:hypothetical protein
MQKLPEFKGYTVDIRLRQFRKIDYKKRKIEFIEFESEKGRKLLEDFKIQ